MKFHIYDLSNLRNKVIIDLPNYLSIDQYLYNNPLTKRLVYAYLKEHVGKIKLSVLDSLFSKTSDILYYSTKEALDNLHDDDLYHAIYEQYIQNPDIWVNGSMQAQSYFFDAKHLLKGEYQSAISEVVDYAINSADLHYATNLTGLRTSKNNDFYQSWFDTKKAIESTFFIEMLSNFENPDSNYLLQYYHDIIEIYDIETSLTLQFTIKSYTNTTLKVLMPKESNRSTKHKRNTLVTKFLMKSKLAENVYRFLTNSSNISFINDYLNSLESLQQAPQFKLLSIIGQRFLEDLRNNEKSTYIDTDWVSLQMVHRNAIERNSIHFSEKTSLLRLYRKVTFLNNSGNVDISLKHYSIPKNLERAAKLLINHGLITFSKTSTKYNQSTFENLAVSKISNEAKLFMRLPIIDSLAIYELANHEVEQLKFEIETALFNKTDIEFEDTRIYKKSKRNINTYFETMQYLNNKIEFEKNRKELNQEKLRLRNSYINNNQGLLHLLTTINK